MTYELGVELLKTQNHPAGSIIFIQMEEMSLGLFQSCLLGKQLKKHRD